MQSLAPEQQQHLLDFVEFLAKNMFNPKNHPRNGY
ncbi:hypothetical protein [Nostoc sp.]